MSTATTLNVYPQSRAEDITRARNYLAMVRRLRLEGVRPGNVAYWLRMAGNLRRAVRPVDPIHTIAADEASEEEASPPDESASAGIARQSLAAKERELRATIANLDGGYLARIGLDTPEAIDRHIAGEMREESAALGLARWAVDPLTGAAPAPEGHRVRVIRPAYTIEQGDRVVLDGH